MDYEHSKLRAWKAAEQAARLMEREVRELLINRAKGEMPACVDQKMSTAAALRVTAHRMLEEALRDIDVTAKALHYRNVTTPTIRPFHVLDASFSRRDEGMGGKAAPVLMSSGDAASGTDNGSATVASSADESKLTEAGAQRRTEDRP